MWWTLLLLLMLLMLLRLSWSNLPLVIVPGLLLLLLLLLHLGLRRICADIGIVGRVITMTRALLLLLLRWRWAARALARALRVPVIVGLMSDILTVAPSRRRRKRAVPCVAVVLRLRGRLRPPSSLHGGRGSSSGSRT